ncbi:sugar transferase [Patulibacter sp.]|uniref:sugar transferase n=1 Tax=Patulibacter sp. TaxID=1912859 RepID=UPI002727E328|nr:sugar transferase [Patulibacter sp.]MDO9407866.1 sugar transferase [Patulibacter sp.]
MDVATPPIVAGERARRRRYLRGRTRQACLVLGDLASIASALMVLFAGPWAPDPPTAPAGALAAVLIGWVAVLHLYGLYPRFPRLVTTSMLDELPRVFHATLVASVLTFIWLSTWGSHTTLPGAIALPAAVIIALPLGRVLVRHALTDIVGPERVLLVGSGSTSPAVERALAQRRDVRLVGQVALPAQWLREHSGDDTLPELERLVVDELVDRVLLATRDLGDAAVGDFMHWSRGANVSLTVLPEHFEVIGVAASFDSVQGATVVSLQPPVLSRTAQTLKRAMDIVGAGAGLVVLAPVMFAVALAVRLDSPGPILFRQERIGHGGRRFGLLKFRTMTPDADALVEELMARSTDPHWLQLENDPRVTKIGRTLRATSLDELPQLWNVLRGHMSLVGPRPLSLRDDARVGGWARGRLDLTPGLTGLWQVQGRKCVPFEEMVKLDYVYVTNWSLWGDIKLLLQTMPAVLQGRGAR